MDPSTTIFIVDDDQAVRDQLSFTVRSVGLDVRTFGSAEEFLEDFDDSVPGCIVLDVRLTGIGGLELQKQLAARSLAPPVILITGHGDIPMAIDAVRSGVVDFLEKPFREQQLLDAMRKAIEQDADNRRTHAANAELRGRLASLTRREAEVLQALVDGKPNRAIAGELDISHKTVETHRTKVMGKMGARTSADLVRMILSIHQGEGKT